MLHKGFFFSSIPPASPQDFLLPPSSHYSCHLWLQGCCIRVHYFLLFFNNHSPQWRSGAV